MGTFFGCDSWGVSRVRDSARAVHPQSSMSSWFLLVSLPMKASAFSLVRVCWEWCQLSGTIWKTRGAGKHAGVHLDPENTILEVGMRFWNNSNKSYLRDDLVLIPGSAGKETKVCVLFRKLLWGCLLFYIEMQWSRTWIIHGWERPDYQHLTSLLFEPLAQIFHFAVLPI